MHSGVLRVGWAGANHVKTSYQGRLPSVVPACTPQAYTSVYWLRPALWLYLHGSVTRERDDLVRMPLQKSLGLMDTFNIRQSTVTQCPNQNQTQKIMAGLHISHMRTARAHAPCKGCPDQQ